MSIVSPALTSRFLIVYTSYTISQGYDQHAHHAVLHTQVPFANSFALSHAMRLDPPVEFEQTLSCVSAWTKLRQMFPALRFTSS